MRGRPTRLLGAGRLGVGRLGARLIKIDILKAEARLLK